MNEKAVSKQQQKFFGIVRGLQTGKIKDASPAAKKAAASMSKKDVKDFAATKHKGLPKKKVDELDIKTLRRYVDRAGKQADTLGTKDQHPKANKRADGEKRAAKKISQRIKTAKKEECWTGYKQVGMKKKGDKMVPDCVPEQVEEKVNEVAPLVGLAARGVAGAAGRYLAKRATKAVAKKIAKRAAVGAAGAAAGAAAAGAAGAAGAAYAAKKAKDKFKKKQTNESANSAVFHRKAMSGAQKDMADAEKKGDHEGMRQAMQKLARHRAQASQAAREERESRLSFSELTDKQRAEIEKRKAARAKTRGARRGPAKGTAPKKADTTGAIKATDFQKGDPDKHMIMQLRKAQDSHKMGRDMELSFRKGKGVASGKDIDHVLKYHDALKKNDDKRKLMHSISKGGVDAIKKHAANFRKATGAK